MCDDTNVLTITVDSAEGISHGRADSYIVRVVTFHRNQLAVLFVVFLAVSKPSTNNVQVASF